MARRAIPQVPLLNFVGRNLGSDINFGTARAWSTTTSLEWFKIDGIQVTDTHRHDHVVNDGTKSPKRPHGIPPRRRAPAGLPVTLKINGVEKTSTNIFSYGGPIITSVAGQGVMMYAGSGTQVMTIQGTQFGPPRFSDLDGTIVGRVNYYRVPECEG